MMNKSVIDYLAIVFGAAIGFMYGDLNGLFYALIALCTLDYITGVMVAIKNHELSSRVGYVGIMRKVGIFILVCVGHLVDMYIINGGNVFMSAVSLYYAANEGISITENSEKLGLPVPKKLSRLLKQVKDDADEDKEEKKEKKSDTDKKE